MKTPAGKGFGNRSRMGRSTILSTLLGAAGTGARPHRRLAFALAAFLALTAFVVVAAPFASGAAPTVTIEAASQVRYTTATANGTVDPADHETSYFFEYATEADFSNAETVGAGSLAEGAGPTPVEAELAGLRPATTYHLRLVAVNSEGEEREAVAGTTITTEAVAAPTVSLEPVATVGATNVKFVGFVNPDAPRAEGSTDAAEQAAFRTEWHFFCSPACPGLSAGGTVEAGDEPIEVTGESTELPAGARSYEVKLVASNGGGEAVVGPTPFTTTSAGPTIESSSGSAGLREGEFRATIDPGNLATTYRFDYGPTASYGRSTETKTIPPAASPVTVTAKVSDLEPSSSYHFHVVAQNVKGTAESVDQAFGTGSAGAVQSCANEQLRAENHSQLLPDCRAYELVSPNASSDANVFVARPDAFEHPDLYTSEPIRAAADGAGIVYAAEDEATGGAGSGGAGAGDVFRALRTGPGWSANDLMPLRSGQSRVYEGFSDDLSAGVLTLHAYVQPPLTPDAPADCAVMYTRSASDEAFHAAFTGTETPGACGSPHLAGISADGSRLIFETEAPLTAQGEGENANNLYESHAGEATLVSVLPDGEAAPDATFGTSEGFPGGVGTELAGKNVEHAISADGSRVIWTDLDTEATAEDPTGATRLFVREYPEGAAARTVQIDAAAGGGGQYRGASSDDSEIYFTKEERLYRFDLESGTTTDLTPAGGVYGVAGVSEDGTEVFFAAGTVLAANHNSEGETATAGSCEPAETGTQQAGEEEAGLLLPGKACNLYALHLGSEPRFVAMLMPGDDATYRGPGNAVGRGFGDWVGNLALRTSEVSRDGQVLAFMSRRHLTGYQSNGLRELFVYDVDGERLFCASCNPSGEPAHTGPVSSSSPAGDEYENYPPLPEPERSTSTYQFRWVSANGGRVFFDTDEALVPQDTNGVEDVYEWEQQGNGSCKSASGCIYLVSGATSSTESFFAEASENGDDVFFTSRADLVPEDHGENVVLYDARVGGGVADSAQGCTGAGCQGVAPGQAGVATPSSVTFEGLGNEHSRAGRSRTRKLDKALEECRREHGSKRRTCVRRARRRYAPVKPAKGQRSSQASTKRRSHR